MKAGFASVALAAVAGQAVADASFRLVSTQKVAHPGFVSSVDHGGQYRDLLIAAFNGAPFSSDYVYAFPEIGKSLDRIGSLSPVTLATNTDKLIWPNEFTQAPEELFGGKGFLVSGGFLVPSKGNGAVWFAGVDKTAQFTKMYKLTTSSGWFYHRTIAYDVNKDGKLDLLTCRAKKPLTGKGSGEMVWLEPQNRTNVLSGGWTERKISDACDVFFDVADLDNDGVDEIVAADFFGSKVTLIYTEDPATGFSNPASVKTRVIEANIGPVFDVEIRDLNLDGRLDLLVTNHQGTKDKPESAVFVFELPTSGSIKTGDWTKRVIADGFPTLVSGIGQASPGAAHTFYPVVPAPRTSSALGTNDAESMTAVAAQKPWIHLAGDGNEKAYVLKPVSENKSEWGYEKEVVYDCKGTVGGIHVVDADRDGYVEMFIPCYDGQFVAVLTAKP